jgi:hypothetical protein
VPESGSYWLQLRVRSNRDDDLHRGRGSRGRQDTGLHVWLGHRPVPVRIPRDAPDGEWWWTEPVRVRLREGAHWLSLRTAGAIDVEAIHVQPVRSHCEEAPGNGTSDDGPSGDLAPHPGDLLDGDDGAAQP